MAASQLSRVIHRLASALPRDSASDGHLLESFITLGDAAALEALVRRHGPMVWGVCRRVLDHHDAEDAFQATFLVLVRRAGSVWPREMVANWLYGVAHQTALKARATLAKRNGRERQVIEMPDPAADTPAIWPDLRPLLDEELSRLPDNYRAVIVLCDLEGKTRQEAARDLGVPEGTVASRLARARDLLADRLARRGLAASGGVLAVLLSQQAASAAVPAAVMSTTITAVTTGAASLAAASLAAGVLKAMFLTKCKSLTATLVALCVLGLGGGYFAHRAMADKPIKKEGDKPAKPAKPDAGKPRAEASGTVTAVDPGKNTVTLTGKPLGAKTFEVAKDAKVLIDDGTGRKTGVREGRLADVAVGAVATLSLKDGRAASVFVEGPQIEGTLTAADAKARTVTLAVMASKKDEPADKVITVAEDAAVSIEDGTGEKKVKEVPLADLKAGTAVTVKLSGDLTAAGSVRSRGQTVTGVYKTADGAKSITVTVKAGGEAAEKTFDLAKDVRVSFGGGKGGKVAEEAKLADLKAGAPVRLLLSLDGKSAVAIQAEGATIRGTLKEVDAEKRTLTVTVAAKNEPAEDKAVEVAKDARVSIDGKDGKLADLPAGAQVAVQLSPKGAKAVVIQADGGGVRGLVRGNATDDSVTIGGKGDDQTFTVGKDTQVIVEGRPGKLSDLIEGTVVNARASADRKRLVGAVNAEGPTHRGIIKETDEKNNKITLIVGGKNGVGGEEKTFALTKKTAIVTEGLGVAREVSDLRAEREVILRLAIDQKAAARIIITGE